MRVRTTFAWLLGILLCTVRPGLAADDTDVYTTGKYQFLSYGAVPTWTGTASDWRTSKPRIHLYDPVVYPGHAEFVSRGLGTGWTFRKFKRNVRDPARRGYVPFFLYDLRNKPVRVGGSTYTWAVRIEDYGYLDSDEQMAQTFLRLLEALSTRIGRSTGDPARGLAMLATSPGVKPNTGIAEALRTRGYYYLTLSQLIERTGGKRVLILNPGTAVGTLRLGAPVGPRDIVVFESMPRRLPPVAGIITLVPQTPLSHVNLLAKNRGTVNLSIGSLDDLPGAVDLIGRLIRLECNQKKVLVQPVDLKSARAYWRSHRPAVVHPPRPDQSIRSIVDLEAADSRLLSPCVVGAKAHNYSMILRAYPEYVRPGFALPFWHYLQTIRACGADDLIQALERDKAALTLEQRGERLRVIRQSIQGARLDPATRTILRDLFERRFVGKRVRLRSSTNCEDLPDFNGAGLYRSKGFETRDSDTKLEQKLLAVFASLWNDVAFSEREYFGISQTGVGMAVLVNEAFRGEAADGVALTITDEEGVSVLVNAQPGDNSVANPDPGTVPESILVRSDGGQTVRSRSSIGRVFTSNAKMRYVLSQLVPLVVGIRGTLNKQSDAEDERSYEVDVEFKVMREGSELRLYIKQARMLGAARP